MEFVFVVPRQELFGSDAPQGLVPFRRRGTDISFEALERAVRDHGFFVERAYAERTPELKQVIPYTLVRVRGVLDGEDGFLLMRRLGRGGEARLHEKLSIGVGGHINPADLASTRDRALLEQGARRELEEELVVEGTSRLRSVGLLNDDANPVGAVHVGLVQVLDLDGTVRIREEDVLEGRLVSAEELRRLRATGANFETWSSLLIERLDELLPVTNPTCT